jgi:hypothetical protein
MNDEVWLSPNEAPTDAHAAVITCDEQAAFYVKGTASTFPTVGPFKVFDEALRAEAMVVSTIYVSGTCRVHR